ncbi:ATP-binding cassette domain-containing protein [Bifidobacterium avesanii]|uniref:ATP-binding cassette domain-containing protein n=1 Tax=Bifidobacterium avesanii TaxID=1798157 RepID=A0A7K3TER1_9BIFI|nr:ATP-binding cassette domain-containing protein [Bifidobacterium avesanii]KAB8295567.1 ABC transporter ATP-binding protein [Bifidobacterium avesanii]NEG77571.1 ATP-binding cassette domain-containing protein [Bifidobacterium avesanii]
MEDNASLTFEGWGYRHASRRHFAVRGLNLAIKPGQRVLLLGASGIGKSTILEGAAGLLGAEDADGVDGNGVGTGAEDSDGGVTEGRILVDGVPVRRARGRVGLVLQDPDAQAVFQRLGDNVAFGPENLGVPREEIWRRVHESLDAVGLDGVELHRSIMHVSGGQQQRIALAGALAMRPGVLLLDEPTANLDPDGVTQIVGAVKRVLDSHHSTMVLVEHRAGPWIDLIDRVVVLGLESADQAAARVEGTGSEGDIDRTGFRRTVVVADGTPDEIFRDPSIDFAALGIWVPERYRRPEDEIRRIHTPGEPDTDPAVGTGETLLSCRDLAIGRNGTAIAQHINLDFAAGQITALVGANGAGKSTLSLTLAGLLNPVGGAVVAAPALAEGAEGDSPFAWKSTELASRISYVFQNPEHQFAKGSVLEEVMVAPLRCGMSHEEAESRARELLKRFSLSQYANANPYTLSGGEKRRLTVASALAAAPRVLILDEPTFGQDRRTWMQIVTLINTLRADGVSIIVVTHDRELVTALGARLVELVPDRAEGEWDSDVVRVSEVNARTEPVRQSSRSPLLASINPVYRLISAFLLSIPLLFTLDWVSATVALGIEFVALLAIGFSPWRVVKSTWPIWVGAPTSALAVLLYGKAGGSTWWQWGLIHVTDRSAELAIATAIRILAIGIPAIITVLGIDATDLADAFSQILHLPDRFVYGGLAGLRLFSVLQDDWAALTASRRSRGLGDENKFKAFGPQAFALLVLSVRRSTTLATAMEARGFGGDGPRSHARVSVVRPRDRAFLVVCLVIPTVALVAAGFAGTFSFMGGGA